MNVQALGKKLLPADRWLIWLCLPLLSAAMHWQVWDMELRGVHVWRQTQTQQAIDAFAQEDFSILNPRRLERGDGDGILRLEFPLSQWLTAAVAKVVGSSVFLSRWMVFLFACIAVGGLHRIAFLLTQSRLTAFLSAFFMTFSPLVYFYGVSVMPDMLALSASIWGLYFCLRTMFAFSWRDCILAAAFIGLGTLVKLPFIVFGLAFLPLFWRIWKREKVAGLSKMLLVGVLALIGMIPAIAWYAWVMPAWGPAGIEGEVLFHPEKWPLLKEILTYHFWQVLPRTVISVGVLPFIVLGIFALMRKRAALGIENGMLGPIWVVGIGFGCFWLYALGIIAIPHDYYFLPLVPIFALLAALGANFGFQKFPMWASVILILLILVVPFMTTRRVADRWKIEKSEFNRDLFSYQNELREAVPNDALVVAGPDFSHMVFLYYINKKGWSWDKNQGLSPEKLRDWRSRGAQFLYCDDRDFDNAADIQPMIGAPLYEYGSVRIFRIKTE